MHDHRVNGKCNSLFLSEINLRGGEKITTEIRSRETAPDYARRQDESRILNRYSSLLPQSSAERHRQELLKHSTPQFDDASKRSHLEDQLFLPLLQRKRERKVGRWVLAEIFLHRRTGLKTCATSISTSMFISVAVSKKREDLA